MGVLKMKNKPTTRFWFDGTNVSVGINADYNKILIQVNDGGEQARISIKPDEALAIAEAILNLHRNYIIKGRFNKLDGTLF